MRFRLTPAERRARVSEGRWGWASPKRMTRKEFIGLRDRMYKEKMSRKTEKTKAAPRATHPKKRGGIMKWILLLIIIGIGVYYYLRKTGRI